MKKLTFVLFLGIFLLTVAQSGFSQTEKIGKVSGKVTEKLSGQPIADVTVSAGTNETKTDSDGNFQLDLPAGNYNLRFSAKGFVELLTAQIGITANRTFVQNAQLSIVLADEKVEVKSDVFATTDDKPVSQTSLNRDEIRNTPGSAGDILRTLSSLPSVTSIGAQFGDYIVRGGTTEENLVYIDNIPVSEFTIFSDKYDNGRGGRGAILASDSIQRAEFSAGGFGAKYGDKMSSVLDVGIRESNRDRVQAVLFSDFGNAGGSIDIPFGKKGGWFTSIRRSYIDLVFDIFDLGDIGRPRNLDIINKGTFDVNSRNKISFTAINSFETYTLDPTQAAASDAFNTRLETQTRSRRIISGLTLSTTIGNSTLSQATIWVNGQHVDGGLRRLDLSRTTQRTRDLRDSQIGFKDDITTSISDKIQLAFGGAITFDQAKYNSFERSGFGFSPIEEEYRRADRISNFVLSAKTSGFLYGQGNFRLGKSFSITPAVRVDRYGITKETLVSPRMSARYAINEKLSINFAGGIYRQQPSLFTLSIAKPFPLSNTPAIDQLQVQTAYHIVGGIEWLPREDVRIRTEFFSKKYRNLIGEAFFPSGLFVFDNRVKGKANGVEISIIKALSGKFAGQVSYSFADAKRTYSGGSFYFPTDSSRPHQFTAIGITRLFGITLAAKYRLANGLPYDLRTPLRIFTTPSIILQQLARIQDRNALRLPKYSNFDFRVEKKFDFKRWSIAPYLDMFNALKSDNKSEVTYSFTRRTPILLGENARLPIFGVRVEF
jgi:TonB dependent receptor/Carboxypeptidase regulatory-like domain/TonB-dependent Receptor Plug Domain